MVLSEKILRSIKDQDEPDLWEYAAALIRIQGSILRMEEKENDPEVVRELASKAIDLVSELDAALAILEEKL